MPSPLSILRDLSKRSPLIKRADATKAGVSSYQLGKLTQKGEVVRVGRGLYQLADVEAPTSELVQVSILQPKGVIILLSALNFHGIGTHRASEVWLQLPINSPTPTFKWPPLRVIRSRKPEAFTEGVEIHKIAGHPVAITSIDRTIVDCFKHRSHVGLEVALEALRERLKDRKGNKRSLQDLHHYARIMRVSKVMQPYLEALI